MRIEALITVPFNRKGISYSCGELLAAMAQGGRAADVHLSAPYVSAVPPGGVRGRAALCRPAARALYRLAPGAAKRLTERAFLRRLGARGGAARPAAAYVWSDTSPGFDAALRRQGTMVVREKFNCSKALSKRVLDEAYRRAGLVPQHGITDAHVEDERRRLSQVDAVFCPNPFVESSVAELRLKGVALLPTSYGFSPERLLSAAPLLANDAGPTFVFVGRICVRKGAHLILRAWARSGVRGRLVLAGALDADVAALCAAELARPDVLRLPFVANVGALYASADAFVFPTLEEGGPQVTYEAAYCGLPLLVSPMGAGRLARSGEDGLVLDPYDEDAWIDAIRTLAADPGLRGRMGASAHARSLGFAWSEVGAARGAQLAAAAAA